MPKLIIVESPNKVSKVKAYAGPGYLVAASVGHLTKLADTRPDQLGFEIVDGEIEIDFHPNGARGKKTIGKLKALADVRREHPRMTEEQIRHHFPELQTFLEIDTTADTADEPFAHFQTDIQWQ